jgi:hypothetical protein
VRSAAANRLFQLHARTLASSPECRTSRGRTLIQWLV